MLGLNTLTDNIKRKTISILHGYYANFLIKVMLSLI